MREKIYKMALADYNSQNIYAVANTVLGLVRYYNKHVYDSSLKSEGAEKMKIEHVNVYDDSQKWNAITGVFDADGNDLNN